MSRSSRLLVSGARIYSQTYELHHASDSSCGLWILVHVSVALLCGPSIEIFSILDFSLRLIVRKELSLNPESVLEPQADSACRVLANFPAVLIVNRANSTCHSPPTFPLAPRVPRLVKRFLASTTITQ